MKSIKELACDVFHNFTTHAALFMTLEVQIAVDQKGKKEGKGTDRQTDRDRKTKRDRDRKRETDRQRQRETERARDRDRQTDTERIVGIGVCEYVYVEITLECEELLDNTGQRVHLLQLMTTVTQRGRQERLDETDRQTDRQTDRDTERQREYETDRQS